MQKSDYKNSYYRNVHIKYIYWSERRSWELRQNYENMKPWDVWVRSEAIVLGIDVASEFFYFASVALVANSDVNAHLEMYVRAFYTAVCACYIAGATDYLWVVHMCMCVGVLYQNYHPTISWASIKHWNINQCSNGYACYTVQSWIEITCLYKLRSHPNWKLS